MTDAGIGGDAPPSARRRRDIVRSVAAALLLLGGGAAVAVGLHAQQDDPPAAKEAGSLSSRPSAGVPSSAGSGTGPGADAAEPPSPALRPTRIRIPSIGVTSALTRVGQHKDGTLEVPQPGPDYDKAAWFTGSPQPGQRGPAVIEGHVDGTVNGPSVFYRLGDVKPGTKVHVTRTDGSNITFLVYAVRLFAKDHFPTFKVYGNTSGAELRLITCGGQFDSSRRAGGYLSNVVVFARQA